MFPVQNASDQLQSVIKWILFFATDLLGIAPCEKDLLQTEVGLEQLPSQILYGEVGLLVGPGLKQCTTCILYSQYLA